MPINKEVTGTILLTSNYQMIYPHITDNVFRDKRWTEGDIFLNELTAGDQIQIKFWKYDPVALEHKAWMAPLISGSQGETPVWNLPATINRWFKVEIKQTLAPSSFKTVNFVFYEVVD